MKRDKMRDTKRDTLNPAENKAYSDACHGVTLVMHELPLYAPRHAQRRSTLKRGSVTEMRDNGGEA